MNALKTLLYFSIFKYPLKRDEIFSFSNLKNKALLDKELSQLLEKKAIYKIDNYYLCENEDRHVERRLIGNNMASEIFPKAIKVSNFIAKFPFVEGVGISGALSKGYHDEKSDIDFFIITSPKRLWVARTLLVLYKKIFLLNSRKYFCVNYFIASNTLEIDEKNRFTATELITMIPMCGKDVFQSFYAENQWAKNYFPNYIKKDYQVNTIKKNFLLKLTERLLKSHLGNCMDFWLMKLTYKKWKSKFKTLDKASFDIAMKSTKNVSKHHPQNFQKKVIDTLNEKYSKVRQNHNITLEPEHA
jgi:hypothetical protein